jgi:putative MATE family efflux protein
MERVGAVDAVESYRQKQTVGVRTLLGDPKKAILELALPMVAAMSIQTLYNLVDAFWVAGLGADALAGIGFVFPFFFFAMALSNGLGVGTGSALSRRIGARDKAGADNVAVHTIVIMVLLAVAYTIPLVVFAEKLFLMIGAGETVGMALAYGQIIFAGSIFLFFTNIGNAILRGEGDARRAMYAMALGAALNIVLDPIFIYTLGMGIAGAAWATVLSLAITSLVMLNWLLLRKDTYVSFRFREFTCDRSIVKDIFGVGVPSAAMQLSMSLTMLVLTVIIVMVGGTDGVAVYSTGWRVASIATLPAIGIATAVVPVSGAAFGAHRYHKINVAHLYAIKIGIAMELVIAAVTFVGAPQIAAVFTQTEAAARIAPDLTTFLRIICLFYPAISFGMLSSSIFQGTGKGMNALLVTLLRTIILTPLLAAFCAFTLQWGLVGIWWGLVAANSIGAIVTFSWVRHFVHGLMRTVA